MSLAGDTLGSANKITAMKRHLALCLAAGALLVAGCNTLEKRISAQQAAFDSWPAEVRTKVQAGRIDIGFTPEQVRVALGEPTRKYQRTTAAGISEVWTYAGGRVGLSLGLGVGTAHGSSAYAGGVAYEPTTYGADDEAVRVVFEGGLVTSVEKRAK